MLSFVPNASVAQLVEHATENRSVGGSNPPRGTILPIAALQKCLHILYLFVSMSFKLE
jgi:hypothetical protein